MRTNHLLLWVFPLFLILSSCGVSDNVVSGNRIQKRKYNKGWFIDFHRNNRSARSETEKDKPNAADKENHVAIASSRKEISEPIQATVNEEQDEIISDEVITDDLEPIIRKPKSFAEKIVDAPLVKRLQTDQLSSPVNDHLKAAKNDYRKTWMFTSIALFSLVIGIFLLSNAFITLHQFAGVFLLILAVAMYVLMFVFLYRTGVRVHDYLSAGGNLGEVSTIRFFMNAHIIIGSLFSLILFAIPLLTTYYSIMAYKKGRR